MSRAVMRKHAPQAMPIGVTADGYASVVPKRTGTVYGVLWRLSPRDCVTLAAWENLAGGLYRAKTLSVRHAGRRRMALVYLARPRKTGRARAGYMELVIAAALEWQLPHVCIAALGYWLSKRPTDAGARELGDFGWT